ncbi:hypothetical protein L596_018069 [Steinernema carpocapsae]|uniref:Uncharacterized protein n=1 Tax=Steinernema carpocapsae TaxID=34508 RepID=A0A4U5N3V4_STECR|nr:hypothetical protein L596_018069 [Steinernema carpocapsae]
MCNIIKKKHAKDSQTQRKDASIKPHSKKPPSSDAPNAATGKESTTTRTDRVISESDKGRKLHELPGPKPKTSDNKDAKAPSKESKSKEGESSKPKKNGLPTLVTRRRQRDTAKTDSTQAEHSRIAPKSCMGQAASRMGDICFALNPPANKKKIVKKASPNPKSDSKDSKGSNAEDDTVYPENQRKLIRQRTRTTASSEQQSTDDEGDIIGVSPTQDDEGPECYMYDDDDIYYVCHEQIAGLENDDLARLEDFALMTKPFGRWNAYATLEEMDERHLFTRGVLTQYTLTSTGMTFPNQSDLARASEASAKRDVVTRRLVAFDTKEVDLMMLLKENIVLKKPVKDNSTSLSENNTMMCSAISRLTSPTPSPVPRRTSKMARLSKEQGSVYKEDNTNDSTKSRSLKKARGSQSRRSRSRSTGRLESSSKTVTRTCASPNTITADK